MLVLTRKPGQTIQVGESITLTVVATNGGRVKIGIDAPRETPVWRGEHQTPPSHLPQDRTNDETPA